VSQYAGQQLLTGQQAEAYADNFIVVHIAEIGGGKTYSQLSALSMAAPKNTALAGQVATVFKGDTLRSMLLNAYGWWKVSQIAYIAALIAFGLGGLALIGSALALATAPVEPYLEHRPRPFLVIPICHPVLRPGPLVEGAGRRWFSGCALCCVRLVGVRVMRS